MSLKWFVQKDDSVDGPMTTEDVQSRLANGQLTSMHMIWGKGLETWIRLESWQQELPQLATAGGATEITPELWHYAHNGKSHGPYSKSQLVEELKNVAGLGEVMIWTKGMKEWAALFEFHDLLSAIGVNKRQFPRAELTGRAVIKVGENTLIGQLVTVSEGGCGIVVDQALAPGQAFTLELQSPSFRDPIHAKAECRYVSEGLAGVRFTHLSSEAKGAIIQLVKQSQTRFVLKAA
jgi:hypothetical protein